MGANITFDDAVRQFIPAILTGYVQNGTINQVEADKIMVQLQPSIYQIAANLKASTQGRGNIDRNSLIEWLTNNYVAPEIKLIHEVRSGGSGLGLNLGNSFPTTNQQGFGGMTYPSNMTKPSQPTVSFTESTQRPVEEDDYVPQSVREYKPLDPMSARDFKNNINIATINSKSFKSIDDFIMDVCDIDVSQACNDFDEVKSIFTTLKAGRGHKAYFHRVKYPELKVINVPYHDFEAIRNKIVKTLKSKIEEDEDLASGINLMKIVNNILQQERACYANEFIQLILDEFNRYIAAGYLASVDRPLIYLYVTSIKDIQMLGDEEPEDSNIKQFQVHSFFGQLNHICEMVINDFLSKLIILNPDFPVDFNDIMYATRNRVIMSGISARKYPELLLEKHTLVVPKNDSKTQQRHDTVCKLLSDYRSELAKCTVVRVPRQVIHTNLDVTTQLEFTKGGGCPLTTVIQDINSDFYCLIDEYENNQNLDKYTPVYITLNNSTEYALMLGRFVTGETVIRPIEDIPN